MSYMGYIENHIFLFSAPVVTPTPPGSSCSKSEQSSPRSFIPGSTVHVTMPTMMSERDDFGTSSQIERIKQITGVSVIKRVLLAEAQHRRQHSAFGSGC